MNEQNKINVITQEQISKIKESLVITNEIKRLSINDKTLGFELPIRDFIAVMQMLTAQSYGSRIQNRLLKLLEFSRVPASENMGDCKDRFGDFYEVKASIVTPTNFKLNLVQIRPWQKIKGYICVAFDTRVDPIKIEVYTLDKNQMKEECEIMRASSAHGTKEANENNINKELRFDINIDPSNEHYHRWQKYRSNLSEKWE
jgi:hypothetical protein